MARMLADLVIDRAEQPMTGFDDDLVIVDSGFGGSVAALHVYEVKEVEGRIQVRA